jgi:hypothetical protein
MSCYQAHDLAGWSSVDLKVTYAMLRTWLWPHRDALYPPPFIYSGDPLRGRTYGAIVHRLCNQSLWRGQGLIQRACITGLIVLWPFIAAARTIVEMRRRGRAVQRLTGKALLQQAWEQWYLAVRYRIVPRYYYCFELYLADRWRDAPDYLMRYELTDIIYPILHGKPAAGEAPSSLKDKLRFAIFCTTHNLPHVPTLFALADGRRIDAEAAPELADHRDVFLKRVRGKGGAGSERWHHLQGGRYRSTKGRELSADALIAYACELSRREPYLVQPALRNHSELLDLTAGALCTIRVVSCRNELGGFEVTDAVLRMPIDPTSPVDNFHAGGIAAPVELRTGKLGRATDLASGLGLWYDRHPFSDAPILGRSLPMWPDCVALAIRAHANFPDRIIIGWDIAVLEDGPYLIEGNRGPDSDILQRPTRRPLGRGRLAELIAYHLVDKLRERS